jgi:hypothetical protein
MVPLILCCHDAGMARTATPPASALHDRRSAALSAAALAISLLACSGGRSTPAPPAPPDPPRPPPIPSVSTRAHLCDADFRETIVALLAPSPVICGHPLFRAEYLRVGVGAHDVILVLVADAFPTETDGPVDYRRWLVIDDELAACDAIPCAALDALGASGALDDAQLMALLTIALSFEPGDPLRDGASVERLAVHWPDQSEVLRARPVGLVREPTGAQLRAWHAWSEAGMGGSQRRLSYRSASLASGRLRVSSEVVLDDFTPNVPVSPREPARPRASEDPLDGMGGL